MSEIFSPTQESRPRTNTGYSLIIAPGSALKDSLSPRFIQISEAPLPNTIIPPNNGKSRVVISSNRVSTARFVRTDIRGHSSEVLVQSRPFAFLTYESDRDSKISHFHDDLTISDIDPAKLKGILAKTDPSTWIDGSLDVRNLIRGVFPRYPDYRELAYDITAAVDDAIASFYPNVPSDGHNFFTDEVVEKICSDILEYRTKRAASDLILKDLVEKVNERSDGTETERCWANMINSQDIELHARQGFEFNYHARALNCHSLTSTILSKSLDQRELDISRVLPKHSSAAAADLLPPNAAITFKSPKYLLSLESKRNSDETKEVIQADVQLLIGVWNQGEDITRWSPSDLGLVD